MPQLLREIVIPNYPDRIRIAERRRPVYYYRGRKMPKRCENREVYGFDSKSRVIRLDTGELVIANRLVGQPRDWLVNFQDIWNGGVSGSARNNHISKLKDALRSFIQSIEPLHERYYPVRIEIIIFDVEMRVDVSNKGVIYTKVIEDLLVREGKLIDDTSEYVNDSGRIKYVKVDTVEERKMIVRIYSSSNSDF